jgi:nitroreductase
VTDKEDIVRLLSFQNGNRGYGDQAGAVLLITADMRAFTMLGERNQAWIDGGLFAMSLNYALHSLGLGACMLNWSVEKGQDEALRAAFAIPEQEVVIMMMAVGHMPERLRVARSPRRPLKSVLSPLAHR